MVFAAAIDQIRFGQVTMRVPDSLHTGLRYLYSTEVSSKEGGLVIRCKSAAYEASHQGQLQLWKMHNGIGFLV